MSTASTSTGARRTSTGWTPSPSRSCASSSSRPARWDPRSKPRRDSSSTPASARQSAPWQTSRSSSRAWQGHRSSAKSSPHDARERGDMTALGVHSEVGKLRKVMVHRPDLSLQRLTPSNHDDLLFDDVLWVERAQYEHDAFVEKMRARDVEVYYYVELLAEALAASEECRTRLIDIAVSEYTVGLSLVDEIRAVLHNLTSPQLAKHLVGGLTVAEAGIELEKYREFSLIAA